MQWLIPAIAGAGAVALIFAYNRRRAAWLNAKRTQLTQLIDDHDNLHLDDDVSTFTLNLGDGVPRIASLTPGDGGIQTGDRTFDTQVALIADTAAWIPLLNPAIRQLMRDIQPVRFDATTQTLIIEADTSYEHGTFPDRIKQAHVLRDRLRTLNATPRDMLLHERLHETDNPSERLIIFKTLWHADQAEAQGLAERLREPAIRYFVATASTPPDRATIEAIVFDSSVDGGVRTKASLRWFGLKTGIYDPTDPDARDGLKTPAAAKHLARLLGVWADAASNSEQALTLLGRLGNPEHAAILGSQRNGPHGDTARRALGQLKKRFPDLQHGGQLAISDTEAGGLHVVSLESDED